MTAVIFFFAAAFALGGALGVVLSRNPVHSALWLVVALLAFVVGRSSALGGGYTNVVFSDGFESGNLSNWNGPYKVNVLPAASKVMPCQ